MSDLPTRTTVLGEIVAAGWLTFPDGELTSAVQVLLVRRGRDACGQAYLTSVTHDGPYLLEYQATPTSDRERFCVDCAADARANGEFSSLTWDPQGVGVYDP